DTVSCPPTHSAAPSTWRNRTTVQIVSTVSLRDREEAAGPVLGMPHVMVYKGIGARFGEHCFDKTALGDRQVERLRAPGVATAHQVGTLLVDGVELGADDVERRSAGGTGRHHPDPDALPDL